MDKKRVAILLNNVFIQHDILCGCQDVRVSQDCSLFDSLLALSSELDIDEYMQGGVTFSNSEIGSLYAAIVNDEVRFDSTNPNLDKHFWSAMNKMRIVK